MIKKVTITIDTPVCDCESKLIIGINYSSDSFSLYLKCADCSTVVEQLFKNIQFDYNFEQKKKKNEKKNLDSKMFEALDFYDKLKFVIDINK